VAVLLGFSMLVAGGFLAAFLWAVRSGQYTDRHTPSMRILFDDDPKDRRDSSIHTS
jgi:cbb3-type cytochrome oxidase maturation protein